MRDRIESMVLSSGSRPSSQVLLHSSKMLVARYGRRWLIETQACVVAGNSLLQAVARLITCTLHAD